MGPEIPSRPPEWPDRRSDRLHAPRQIMLKKVGQIALKLTGNYGILEAIATFSCLLTDRSRRTATKPSELDNEPNGNGHESPLFPKLLPQHMKGPLLRAQRRSKKRELDEKPIALVTMSHLI